MSTEPVPRWAPQPGPQAEAIAATWCQELLFGGSAGGGKTDFLLGDYLQDVPRFGDAWQGAIFRRTYRELEEIVTRSLQLYPSTGGTWEATRHRWVWPNGATLRLRYVERDQDVTRYQGAQFS
jgi:phage terminase large subunit-like protein